MHEPIEPRIEQLAAQIVEAAFRVHRALGPGLLESVYETCLCHELAGQRIRFRRQVEFPVVYEGLRLETGLRLDLLVDELIIVEVKAVEQMQPLFDAQVLTYLKLTGKRLGLLINFNVPALKDGLKRFVL
jgi:GxxExxY protein